MQYFVAPNNQNAEQMNKPPSATKDHVPYEQWPLWVKVIVTQMWKKTDSRFTTRMSTLYFLIVLFFYFLTETQEGQDSQNLMVLILSLGVFLSVQTSALLWVENNSSWDIRVSSWKTKVVYGLVCLALLLLPSFLAYFIFK